MKTPTQKRLINEQAKRNRKWKSAKATPSVQPAAVAEPQALIPDYAGLLAASNDIYQACMSWLSTQTSADRERVKAALQKYARGSWMA